MNTTTKLKELLFDAMSDPKQSEMSKDMDLPFELPNPEEMIEEGADPQFAVYSMIQSQLMMTAIMLEDSGEVDDYHNTIETALEKYMPAYPPMSPVTDSYFYLWALCDLRFGKDKENIGEIANTLIRTSGAPDEMLVLCEQLVSSRMGIYETIGEENEFLVVRELVTNRELLVDVPTNFPGSKGMLRFVRLGPPLQEEHEYYTELTTPYILENQSVDRWTACLETTMPESVTSDDGTVSTDVADRLASLFKDDCGPMPWIEFVFQAYHHFEPNAIFLHGIPNDPESLPHKPTAATSPTFSGGSNLIREAKAHGITIIPKEFGNEPDSIEFSLTQPQRKTAAELLPDLSDMFPLGGKGRKSVTLSWHDGERLSDAVEEAIQDAEGSRLTTLRNLWNTMTDTLDSATGIREAKAEDDEAIFRMRIDLRHSSPPIWRRVEVPDCLLAELHDLIQSAMGWEDSHEYQFRINDSLYSQAGYSRMIDALDDDEVMLSDILQKGSTFLYEYDFGDDWEHDIKVEKIIEPMPDKIYPRCVKGQRNCPPEDCGGIFGYYQQLEALADTSPDQPEYEELQEWFGNTDPNHFDSAEHTQLMQNCFDDDGEYSGEFNIHETFFEDGDLDEDAFDDYCNELLDRFVDSPEYYDRLPEGDYGFVRCLFDYGINYLGVTPTQMSVAEFDEVLFSIVPRKVSVDADEAKTIVSELNAFFRFLHREFEIGNALKIAQSLDAKAVSRLAAELADESNFGMAKSFFSMGKKAGYDMTTEEGLNRFMLAYNSSLQQDAAPEVDDQFEPAVTTIKRSAERLGRNDPCHCGSGKKYKKCCLRSDG